MEVLCRGCTAGWNRGKPSILEWQVLTTALHRTTGLPLPSLPPQACLDLNIPWIDIATSFDAMNTHVSLHVPGHTACLYCAPGHPAASPPLQEATAKLGALPHPALPCAAAMAASVGAMLATKLLLNFG